MLVTTTETLPGHEIVSVLGFVDGSAAWLTKGGGLRNFTSEGVKEDQQDRSTDTIRDALRDIDHEAKEMGANAVIGLRVCPVRGKEASVVRGLTQAVVIMYVYGT